ncbi:hypothetical protein AX15_004132 [Amanita polypyramis BW_CC]|nr:hypothetical protein AX15_004132 [Amanita polypyramis BW_CC]
MSSHPNFPDYLDIAPSQLPNELKVHLGDRFGPRAQEEAIRRFGIAGRVWEAAYGLSLYVQPAMDLEFDPPFISPSDRPPLSIIELGSGSGLVAAAIATRLNSLHDLIIATDLPEVCQLLSANLRHTACPSLAVRPLTWGNAQHATDISSEFFNENRSLTHVICSDLVYFPDLFAPLMRSLIHLTSSSLTSSSPKIIISYKIRSLSKETLFWSTFGLWFEFSPVLTRDKSDRCNWRRFGASTSEDALFIFVARRRPQSFHWHVPLGDLDLLNGVGAWGTNHRKGDDTFESLLLLRMDMEDAEK